MKNSHQAQADDGAPLSCSYEAVMKNSHARIPPYPPGLVSLMGECVVWCVDIDNTIHNTIYRPACRLPMLRVLVAITHLDDLR